MKKLFFLLACLLLLSAGSATVSMRAEKTHSKPTSPSFGGGRGEVMYYTGDDAPASSSGVVTYSGE